MVRDIIFFVYEKTIFTANIVYLYCFSAIRMGIMYLEESTYQRVIQHWQHLHRNPELSFSEYNTQSYIIHQLNFLGIKTEKMANTGVIATIGSGKKCIALRSDIDALPIHEKTGSEFASENPNIMHACGHDAHTAILLGVAEILKKRESDLQDTVKLIFQPGEEDLPGGATQMIAAGVLENPAVDEIYALHVFPDDQVGNIAIADGPIFATSNTFEITINGKGCHSAKPDQGDDPILCAANLINYYQSIVTKFTSPVEPVVITVSSIDGRSVINAIPDKVKIGGIVRTFNDKLKKEVIEIIEKNSKKIAEIYNCTIDFETEWGYPVLVNAQKPVEKIIKAAESIIGQENVLHLEKQMYAEDFASYTQKVPGALFMLGVRPTNHEQMPTLHSANFIPDSSAFRTAINIFVEIALNGRK